MIAWTSSHNSDATETTVTDEWEEFVNSEFDKYGVDNWFDYYHEGGAIEDAIDFGEQCCINDYNS